jgi:CDP-diacylglycerol--serine O-phosphatidyltransferase
MVDPPGKLTTHESQKIWFANPNSPIKSKNLPKVVLGCFSGSSRHEMGFVIATCLTLGNAICGFIGIALLMLHARDATVYSCLLIFGAWVFDMIDGAVARRFGVDGPLGAILDSLCDVVSFAVLPAAIIVSVDQAERWSLVALGAGSIYVSAAILRLGRYAAGIAKPSEASPRLWFTGLSSPAAGMSVAAAVLAAVPAWSQISLLLALATLMVSTFPYPDIVKFFFIRRLPWWSLVAPLALAIVDWKRGVAVIVVLYVCSGPLIAAWRAFGGRIIHGGRS